MVCIRRVSTPSTRPPWMSWCHCSAAGPTILLGSGPTPRDPLADPGPLWRGRLAVPPGRPRHRGPGAPSPARGTRRGTSRGLRSLTLTGSDMAHCGGGFRRSLRTVSPASVAACEAVHRKRGGSARHDPGDLSSGVARVCPVFVARPSSAPGYFRSPGTTSGPTAARWGGSRLPSRRARTTPRICVEIAPDPQPDPDAGPPLPRCSICVEAALRELPEHYRVVVWLRDGEDLSYDEIAQVLDVPIGTVRSRLARARSSLRQAVGW